MRLFPEVIANFATGCQGWEWHEDYWRAERMPKIMQPLYVGQAVSNVRMQCTSCVRLRFVSDTTSLSIELAYGVRARELFKCELLVDGQRVHSEGFGPDATVERWQGVIFENPKAQMRTFDLWLSDKCQVDVVEMQLDDACVIEPAEPLPIRWLAYGDSITQGMVSTLPTRNAVGIAALANQAEVFNLAIGGAVLAPELALTVPDGQFDLISIAYGTNDYHRSVPIETYQANAKALLEKLIEKFPLTPILLITTLTMINDAQLAINNVTLAQYRDCLQPLASLSSKIRQIDGRTLIADDQSLFVDKVHPNDAGFAIYGKLLGEHVNKAVNT